jgi:hypothetical protein
LGSGFRRKEEVGARPHDHGSQEVGHEEKYQIEVDREENGQEKANVNISDFPGNATSASGRRCLYFIDVTPHPDIGGREK